MNRALLHKQVQEFIAENYKAALSKIIFKGSPFPNITTQELAIQLAGKKKAEKKLPTWFKTNGIIYPPALNLEQTSSEITANYKSSLISGKSLVDLTGGFGIDSYFFSRHFEKVIHCELNDSLSRLIAHNNKILGVNNIETLAGDGIEFLKNSSQNFDWIYLDPSRRDNAGGRVFHLADCLPNVPENLDFLFTKASCILIKTSPLLDLKAGISVLKGIKEIHIVAVENEVKELLWLLDKNASGAIKVKTINIRKKRKQVYEKSLGPKPGITFSTPLTYLYEPNAAIMKSGLFENLAADFQLEKLHPNTHLFTSEKLMDFPGRRFKIIKAVPFNKKKNRSLINFDKAHIATRNFPEPVAVLRKQFKLKDGGDDYLFFITTGQDKKILLLCKKIE